MTSGRTYDRRDARGDLGCGSFVAEGAEASLTAIEVVGDEGLGRDSDDAGVPGPDDLTAERAW